MWISVGQEAAVLAAGAWEGMGCLFCVVCFTLVCPSFFFLPFVLSLEDVSIQFKHFRGGRVVRLRWLNFQCRAFY